MRQFYHQEQAYLSSHSSLVNEFAHSTIQISTECCFLAAVEGKSNVNILEFGANFGSIHEKFHIVRKFGQSSVKDIGWLKIYDRKTQKYQLILIVLTGASAEIWFRNADGPNKESFVLKDNVDWDKQFVAHKIYCLQKNSSVLIQDTRGNIFAKKLNISVTINSSGTENTTWNPIINKIQYLHIDGEENVLIVSPNHQHIEGTGGRETESYYDSRQFGQLLLQHYKHGICINGTLKSSANISSLRPHLDVPVFTNAVPNTAATGTKRNLHNVCKFGDFYLFLISSQSAYGPSKAKVHDSSSLRDPVLSTILSHPEVGGKSSFQHILPGGKVTLLEALHVAPASENSSLESLLLKSKISKSTGVTLDDVTSANTRNQLNEDTMIIPTITRSQKQAELSTIESLFNLSKVVQSIPGNTKDVAVVPATARDLSIEIYLPEDIDNEELAKKSLRLIETVKINITDIPENQINESIIFDMVSEYTMNHEEGYLMISSSQINQVFVLHMKYNHKRPNAIDSSYSANAMNTTASKYFSIRIAETLTLSEKTGCRGIKLLPSPKTTMEAVENATAEKFSQNVLQQNSSCFLPLALIMSAKRSSHSNVSISTFKEFDYDLWIYQVLPNIKEQLTSICDDKTEPAKAKKKNAKDAASTEGLSSAQFDTLMNFLKSMESSMHIRFTKVEQLLETQQEKIHALENSIQMLSK